MAAQFTHKLCSKFTLLLPADHPSNCFYSILKNVDEIPLYMSACFGKRRHCTFFLKKRLFLTFLQLFEISGEIKKSFFLSFFFSFLNFRAIEFKTIDLLSLTFYYEISLKEIFR